MTANENKPGKRGNTGKYTATPISITFPADCKNADYAGKTFTYQGRGRKPRWWDLATELNLIPEKKSQTAQAAKTDEVEATEPKAATAQA